MVAVSTSGRWRLGFLRCVESGSHRFPWTYARSIIGRGSWSCCAWRVRRRAPAHAICTYPFPAAPFVVSMPFVIRRASVQGIVQRWRVCGTSDRYCAPFVRAVRMVCSAYLVRTRSRAPVVCVQVVGGLGVFEVRLCAGWRRACVGCVLDRPPRHRRTCGSCRATVVLCCVSYA